jgi:four helix bundle protein
MKIQRFEDILAWQKARDLAFRMYSNFSKNKDYPFRDQVQRAVISIMNNIAEGFERKGNKELKQFLFIAKGSAGEVRSMLDIALGLRYIEKSEYEAMHDECEQISKMLSAFIKTL